MTEDERIVWDRLRRTLVLADLEKKVQSLPEKENMLLMKGVLEWGIKLSGGEKQKLALDPQAEYEVYKNLNHVSENRTAIFISHRMSSCRFCDRILVFDEGRLVQKGSHEELLGDVKGKYYQLWRSQEQYYTDGR